MTSLALFTTVYPGVARFLPDWYESVQRQTDKDFQLWIALDGLQAGAVEEILGARLRATWVLGRRGRHAGPGAREGSCPNSRKLR